MAEVESFKTLSLSEQYVLEKEEKADVEKTKPVEVTKDNNAESPAPVEITKDDDAESPAPVEEVKEDTNDVIPPAEESSEASPAASVESTESTVVVEETPEAAAKDTSEQEASGDQDAEEETSGIKLATAPADYRFPTTNQSRHCFTRYIEYHRCIAAKGEDASECEKFAKYYRSLCPGEWIERWNEQRENGTFPGPL